MSIIDSVDATTFPNAKEAILHALEGLEQTWGIRKGPSKLEFKSSGSFNVVYVYNQAFEKGDKTYAVRIAKEPAFEVTSKGAEKNTQSLLI